jgi:hypothetical protein
MSMRRLVPSSFLSPLLPFVSGHASHFTGVRQEKVRSGSLVNVVISRNLAWVRHQPSHSEGNQN